MNALVKFVATLGLAPIAVFRSCDHKIVNAEEYTALAGEVSTSSIGPFSVTTASYLEICAHKHKAGPKKDQPYFRIKEVTYVTYIEKNGQAGYQSGEDVFVDSKGSKNDRPQSKIRVASLSSYNSKNDLNANHWQLEVLTDTDTDNDGKIDRLATHGSF